MEGDTAIISELQRINISLTQALCHQQDLVAKINRQLFYAREDLQNSQTRVAQLEKMLLQQQQQPQQQQPQQYSMPAPNALFLNQFGPPLPQQQHQAPPVQVMRHQNNSFMEHRMAGTLHSPIKKGRLPLASRNDNDPLTLDALPKRSNVSKRVPMYSPPAKKPSQKKASNRPTPEKMAQSSVAGVAGVSGVAGSDARPNTDKQKSSSALSLTELRNTKWTVSENKPKLAECRSLLTAIYHESKGDNTLLKFSVQWLSKNITACRSVLAEEKNENADAGDIVANIESWLQHNLDKRWSKGGTLPIEIDQARQVLASAALFNQKKMNVDQVRRVLPSVGGKARMYRIKELNSKMINEKRNFVWLERKVQKDAMWPLLCLFVRRKICWNDKYTKVDTNFSRKIKCKEPVIESMDRGGFRLTGWNIIEREMRMWYEETKLSDVLKLIVSTEEWKQLKNEYPSISIGKSSLRLALCPSVRKPSFRSCVNEKMSALSYLLEDFHSIINNSEVLRQRISQCQCQRHQAARNMREMGEAPPKLWHEELRCLPSQFCGIATCEKKEQPLLRVGTAEPPKLRDKQCTKSECPRCGFSRKLGLGAADCTAFKDCDELMDVTLWEKASRNGDRFQREPTRHTGADRKTVGEFYSILVEEVAPVALEHLGEAQWWHTHVERKVATFDSEEILIYTDFSATPELVAKEVGNCHEAEHCVIDILVVLDDPRTIDVVKDGETTSKRLNNCTYWAFLGPTDGKGKKNDHRFHREALHSVVEFHRKKALHRSADINKVTLLTDNCSGQYKSQYNMGDVAWFAESFPEMRLEHGFATVFEFKGVHDGFGKTVKWKMKEAELKGHRIPDAKEAYDYLLDRYAGPRSNWDALEQSRSPKLLQRGAFTMTEVRIGYVADTKEESDSIRQSIGGDHVLHCDRVSVPRIVGDKAAEGLTDIYSIRGKRESILSAGGKLLWELELASRVCFCSVCTTRDSHNEMCPYENLRKVRRIKVDDKANDSDWCEGQRAKAAVALYFWRKKHTGYVNMDQMRDELNRIGKPFPPNARRRELALIFLSMEDDSTISAEEQMRLALEEDVQNPEHRSFDDDVASGETMQELPYSEEEAPTDIEQLAINDIEEEAAGNDYNISDTELKLMPDFSILSDTVLQFLLSQRRKPTSGSRAEQEEQLAATIRPF